MATRRSSFSRLTLCTAFVVGSLAASAQTLAPAAPMQVPAASTTVPAPATTSPAAAKYYAGPTVSRFDLYGGYGYFHPVSSGIAGTLYQPITAGAVTSVAGYLTPHYGLQAEGSFFPSGPNDCIYTAQAGPIARLYKGRYVPFAHALFGGAKVGGPQFQGCSWGYGATAGLGLDYVLRQFHDRVAIRPIQADYEYSHVDYGPLVGPANVSGGLGVINAYRLSAGVVLRFEDMRTPPQVTLTCDAKPSTVFIGDLIAVTGTVDNFNPKLPITWTWSANGGRITGKDTTASIDTKAAAPGAYTAMGHVTQGPKAYQSADCTASYTVRAYDPPSISCSANPSSVTAGDISTITSVANSPQNRALTYSYSATGGQISGNSNTAQLATAGSAPGTITITCNVVDDLGKTAAATTTVSVSVPPVPPVPQPSKLCSVTFDRDAKRPNRVDNEAKACLDDIALTLQRQTDAKLVVVGNYATGEKADDGAERALNVDQYLTVEKGIDGDRIQLRTGDAGTKSVDNTLVPPGATFPDGATVTFDHDSVKRHGQAYGRPRVPAKGKRAVGKARAKAKAKAAPAAVKPTATHKKRRTAKANRRS